jgi:hypothetical protein
MQMRRLLIRTRSVCGRLSTKRCKREAKSNGVIKSGSGRLDVATTFT